MEVKETMLECWKTHPVDDKDYLDCLSIKDCRSVRSHVDKLQAELKEAERDMQINKRHSFSVIDETVEVLSANEKLEDENTKLQTKVAQQAKKIERLEKYKTFVQHIENHLKEAGLDEPVICTLCDKTIEQISGSVKSESERSNKKTSR